MDFAEKIALHKPALRQLISRSGDDKMALFQIMNLERIKSQYGEDWAARRERVLLTCECFLKRRAGKNGVVIQSGEGFILLPEPKHGERQDQAIKRIQEELEAFFLGEESLQGLSVSQAIFSLGRELLEGEERTERDDDVETKAFNRPASENEYNYTDEPVSALFKPVWSASSGHIAACLAAATGSVHTLSVNARPPRELKDIEKQYAIDCRMLTEVGDGLGQALAGQLCAVALPVHFATLATPRVRMPYLEKLAESPALTRRSMMARIIGMPVDAPASIIAEVTRVAKARFSRVIIDATFDRGLFFRTRDACVDGVFGQLPVQPSERWWDSFTAFNKVASIRGLKTGIINCDHLEQLEPAKQAGASLFAGNILPGYRQDIWNLQAFDPMAGAVASNPGAPAGGQRQVHGGTALAAVRRTH